MKRPPGTLSLSERAAQLELEGLLGQGGMALVWSAQQTTLGRAVAVKALRPDRGALEDRARFEAEARIVGRLEHPNIVPVHSFGHDEEGRPHLCMRAVRGVEWERLLAPETAAEHERALHYDQAAHLRLFQRVCEAVAYAHSQGVVHRDLKPENVLVGDFGEALVTDWGIALDLRRPPEAAAPGSEGFVGTPAYAAPEMANGGDEGIGPWTDVYLLGGILYRLLTGSPPHLGDSLFALLLSAWKGEIEPPQQRAPDRLIPPDLAELALRALARDPAERPAGPSELAEAVEEHFRNEAATRLAGAALEQLAHWESRASGGSEPAPRLYAGLERAVAGLVQALALWPGCGAAQRGLLQARLATVRVALARGDADVAEAHLAQLAPTTPGLPELRERAQALRRQEAAAPQRRGRRRALLALAIGVALLALALGQWALVRARRTEEANERRQRAQQVVDGATWKSATDKIQMYERAIAVDPEWREAFAELAGAYQDRAYEQYLDDPAGCAADLRRSRRVLDLALRQQPDYATALSYRSYANQMLGQQERMAADCRRLVQLVPDSSEGRAAATLLALAERRYAEAERLTSEIIAGGEGDEDTYTRRAVARFVLGDLDGGLEDMDEMALRAPQTAFYDAVAALFLLAKGERYPAAERLLVAARKGPRSPNVLPMLAWFAAARGDGARARLLEQRARVELRARARCYLDLEPVLRTLTAAPAPRDELGRAFVLELDLNTVVPRATSSRGLRRSARRALRRGNPEAALGWARRALAEDPTDGGAHLLEGLALQRLGFAEAAREALAVASTLAPDRAAEAEGARRAP